MSKEKWSLELSEYIKQGEPEKQEKAKTWETAIGLQDVDGLKPSEYLLDTAKEHIEGNINIDEAKKRINSYYEQSNERNNEDNTEEADKVSVRIAEILSEKAFNFSPTEMLNIHKRLFTGIYKEAGKYREYNFTKKEWILNDDTVTYSSYETIKENIEYDFNQEKNFSYKNLGIDDLISHLSRFISNIWQVHPFCEGNTRTTAVFLIKYLRTFGFNVNDEIFADNSRYFRNALVRANYKNYEKNVFEDITFLEKFFYNLLTNTKYELKNRYMHIDYKETIEEISSNVSSLSLEEQAILNIIKNNPSIKQEAIALQINKSVRTIKNYMSEMQKRGIIERKNGKRDGEWIILKSFND